jgi:2-dehydropantoate 2-reductase
MTKICIFGAGAIGGYIAARLALRGECEVSVVARGAHLQAINAKGLTLKQGGETRTVKIAASRDADVFGPQDFVILTLKAGAIPAAVPALKPLLGPETAVLFGQNGFPWWYFHKHGGPFEGRSLESVDPAYAIWNGIGPERAIGAVVWQAAELESPGVVVHNYGDRMPIAEPSDQRTSRVRLLSALLTAAGIKSPVKGGIRDEIWLKLWGNLSFNPVSVLTGGTLVDLAGDPGTRRVIHAMMDESRAVAEAIGVSFSIGAEERMDMAARVGAHKTSMLQDIEQGRPTELDAILGAVIELAQMTSIETPALKLVYDLVKFRARAVEVRG